MAPRYRPQASPEENPDGRLGREGESGFSLLEVLIVVAIIGILVGMVMVSLLHAFEKSKQRATMADMRTISKAVETYQIDTGHYPSNGQTITQLAVVLVPYQSSIVPIRDGWQHPYTYSSDNANLYSIESFGKDGIDGANIDYANRFTFDLDLVLSNGLFTASPEQ